RLRRGQRLQDGNGWGLDERRRIGCRDVDGEAQRNDGVEQDPDFAGVLLLSRADADRAWAVRSDADGEFLAAQETRRGQSQRHTSRQRSIQYRCVSRSCGRFQSHSADGAEFSVSSVLDRGAVQLRPTSSAASGASGAGGWVIDWIPAAIEIP